MVFLRAWTPAVAALVVMAGCSRTDESATAPAAPPPPAPAPAPPAPAPAPQPPPTEMGRTELLAAASDAAAAAAVAAPPPAALNELAGRQFKVRLPFGCLGPTEAPDMGYVYDAKRKTLKITVSPQVWTETPWAQALVAMPESEAIEGFWVRRPWVPTEACPARVEGPDGEPARETLGLARVFSAEDSRVTRRSGRPYELTTKIDPDRLPGPGGLRLVLGGRIASPEVGPPVRCRSLHPDRPPVCLVLVDIDHVAVERPEGEILGEWSS